VRVRRSQDDPSAVEGLSGSGDCARYFKRSWAPRRNGTATLASLAGESADDASAAAAETDGTAAAAAARSSRAFDLAYERPAWFRPLPFSTLQRYFASPSGIHALPHAQRPISVACLLRPHSALHFDPSRARVLRSTFLLCVFLRGT
jgi:hypothetical protein